MYSSKVYPPRRGKIYRHALIRILFATAVGWYTLGAAVPPGWHVFLLSLVGLFMARSVLALIGLMYGLPRLSANEDGVEIKTLLRTQWAAWGSLTAFELTPLELMRIRRPLLSANARITGTAVSRNLRRKRHFAIPDIFDTRIEAISNDLNFQRSVALREVGEPLKRDVVGVANPEPPWVTFILLFVLVDVFVLQQIFAVGQGGLGFRSSTATLLALGGFNRHMVLSNNEWYRLFTSPVLHVNLEHLLGNCTALLLGGLMLERLLGRTWFLALFIAGALGGCLASFAADPPAAVGVGASGGIMALFAATFVASFRLPQGRARLRLQIRSCYILIASLLPSATSMTALRIDYGVHVAGAVVGATIAVLLLALWPAGQRQPQFLGLAKAVCSVVLVLFCTSVAEVAAHYPGQTDVRHLERRVCDGPMRRHP